MPASDSLPAVQQGFRGLVESAQRAWEKAPKHSLRNALLWVLSLWLLWGLVKLVWAFFPVETPPAPPAAGVVLGKGSTINGSGVADLKIDVAAVNKWQLFGVKGKVPVAQPVKPASTLSDEESNAEETRLQLTLNGIIESDTEENSRAIITYQGKQDHYMVGDKLPVSGRVELRRLLADRVLINNSGKTEALFLFDARRKSSASTAQAPSTPAPPVTPASARPSRASLGSSMRDRLMNNPMSITDVVRISEARENGTLIGYKVRPSKDREQFEQLGLKNDDIVLAVNGVALDNVSNAMRVFQSLRTETEASFDISRAGENISLVVSLDDVTTQ